MKTKIRSLILIYSALLLVGLIVGYIAILLLPGYIPYTPFNISGMILIGLFFGVLYLFQKSVWKYDSEVSILQMTGYSALVCLFAEICFQLTRVSILVHDTLSGKVYYFFLGVIEVSFMSTIMAYLIAYKLKTKKMERGVSTICIVLVLAYTYFKQRS